MAKSASGRMHALPGAVYKAHCDFILVSLTQILVEAFMLFDTAIKIYYCMRAIIIHGFYILPHFSVWLIIKSGQYY